MMTEQAARAAYAQAQQKLQAAEDWYAQAVREGRMPHRWVPMGRVELDALGEVRKTLHRAGIAFRTIYRGPRRARERKGAVSMTLKQDATHAALYFKVTTR